MRYYFTAREVLQLTVSTIVLGFAFALPLSCSRLIDTPLTPCGGSPGLKFDLIGALLPFALIIVLLSFVLHELAHKLAAQALDLEAEYRASYPGLGMGLGISAVLGVVLASPGVVLIWGPATKQDAGIIGIAGPVVNIVLGGISAFLSALYATDPIGLPAGAAVGDVFHLSLLINAVLAAFNMVPVRPLDGSKVIEWSVPLFILTWGLILLLVWLAIATPAGVLL